MEYLQENNLSKYKLSIDCNYFYYFVKTEDVFSYNYKCDNDRFDCKLSNNNIFSKIKDLNDYNKNNIFIKKYYIYSDDAINNIINYCNKNNYMYYLKNLRKIYFNNICKVYTEYYNQSFFKSMFQYYKDISYIKEINVIDKKFKDYISYFHINSYYKSVIFPTLTNYDFNIEFEFIKHFQKDFNTIDLLTTNYNCKNTSINIDIFDNKCLLYLEIGNIHLNKKNPIYNDINNELHLLTSDDKLNINLKQDILSDILKNNIFDK